MNQTRDMVKAWVALGFADLDEECGPRSKHSGQDWQVVGTGML